ncbi:MAG: putative peptide zinc metalloprotease protein [Solirubrobacteraceae bacterium]|nr:putative peptide zinc metalloprotease protein [Solirubrobacteraceae bacterium]
MTSPPPATTIAPPPEPPAGGARASKHGRSRPQLAEGIELIGEYEGSGFKEAPYIARRGDGQTIQLTQLLHLVAEACDGTRDEREIGAHVSERFGRRVSAGNVQFLVERKLRPLGVLAEADGSSPELKKPDQLLALKFRTALVPERYTHVVTRLFKPLFLPPVVFAVLAALIALDVWVFGVHGIGAGVRAAVYQPWLLLVFFAAIVVATAFHECGHATACAYGGARPGVLGAGIYVVWPVFYCDVTDAYRLGKGGRLRTDLGGIYFNAIFALATAGLYAVTSFEPLLLIVVLQNFAILQQLMPLLRLDGYYIVSDITGVPDILNRVRPILTSLIPGRAPDPKVAELKAWVRVAVTTYILVLIPVMLFALVMMVLGAPRMVATAYDSLGVLADKFSTALDAGKGVNAAACGLQMTALLLPVAGMTATSGRVGRRVVGGAWRWSDGDPVRRTAIGALLAGGIALAAFTWWPNGEYRPIQPGEKGTLASGVDAIAAVPTGRPALTRERERQLHGAPTVREHGGDFRHIAPAAPQDSTGEDSGKQTQSTPDATTTTPTTTTPAAAAPDPATTTPAPTETTPADPAVAPPAQTTTPSPTTGTP